MTDGTDTELITSPIFLGRKNQEAFISENIEEIVTDEEHIIQISLFPTIWI